MGSDYRHLQATETAVSPSTGRVMSKQVGSALPSRDAQRGAHHSPRER